MEHRATTGSPLVEWGVVVRPLPGEIESGDLYLVKAFPQGVLVGAVDGLGHGREAASAARIAVATLAGYPGDAVDSLLSRCHELLRGTRGAVMTLASIRMEDNIMTWLGVGNVEGLLLRAHPDGRPAHEYVVLRGGVVGDQLPRLQVSIISLRPGDTLIFATDGIRHGFAQGLSASDPPQEIADRILATHGKSNDDALVLVVRYLGPPGEG